MNDIFKNVRIYGTYENPLFVAKDIGIILNMVNIREILR